MEDDRDRSTYSAVFAVLLIVLIVIGVGYGTTQNILRVPEPPERTEEPEENDTPDDGVILYENLSDEEADRIISELLRSGEENLEKIEQIEATILE